MTGMAGAMGVGGTTGPAGWDGDAVHGAGVPGIKAPVLGSGGPPVQDRAAEAEGPSFLAELARALQRLEGMAGEADAMAQGLLTGQVDDVSQVMIATEKARLAVELAVQLRNKAIEAYQEIMRMPI